jgi:hypothetical protein
MAKLERVKKDQQMYKAFNSLQQSDKNTLEMAYKSFREIETSSGTDNPSGTSHKE